MHRCSHWVPEVFPQLQLYIASPNCAVLAQNPPPFSHTSHRAGIVCIRPKRRCHTVTSCERCQLSTERLNVVDKQGFSRSAIVPTSKGATKRLNTPCLTRFHSWQKSSTQVTGTSGGTEESASLLESTTAFEHQEHSSCDAVVAPIICHSVFCRMREHRAGPSSRNTSQVEFNPTRKR